MQSHSQYYLRGEVKDENGQGIYNAKIFLSSKGTIPFYTGSSGAFGIPLSTPTDSIIFMADGYETIKTLTDARKYNTYTLKFASANALVAKHKLYSLVPQNADDVTETYYNQGETYTNLIENDFTFAEKYPETGFALNINRASYSNIRRFLNNNMTVPPDAVRIEEMLNYFDFADKANTDRDNFSCATQLTQSPWDVGKRLLFIKFKAPYINVDTAPPTNLVFLVDVSGSMENPNRLPLLKDAFKMLVNNLRDKDTIAMVIYGGIVGTYLQPISCKYKDSINRSIDKLEASGETPGEAAIRTAYALAERMYKKEANNRIILATDGDFNVGQTTDKELEDLVVTHRNSGIYLTCLGVGMGNYKDSKLEILAKKGNGNFAYIDNIYEAEKVLISEFSKTMYAVANDASVNVYFNPYYVKRYRLIGFDNRKELLENSVAELEGGEVGSGHSLMAVFEIEPVDAMYDSIMRNNPDVNIAQLQLHYKVPQSDQQVVKNFSVPNNFEDFNTCDSSIRFATSVIMFGGLLKQSELWENLNWEDIIKIARNSAMENDFSQKEFVALVGKAKIIYEPYRKKKKKEQE
ncbi:DUF3520 domain-containing protein [Panacibacter ginsenosidivorans]|uniref:DUF3520 domain-containing protein n=1 Tax=Panacibacter ginsenosidivorans TaxID=1813871 RepID=A0A5B8V950_9BACT|nr:von Willebrand factor type A domain-containing protein [Panacibacter ginsenosidivorans]QEC67759.1 DUF3520 domain-containing protein [Panacibacter ginsenosidivorans]